MRGYGASRIKLASSVWSMLIRCTSARLFEMLSWVVLLSLSVFFFMFAAYMVKVAAFADRDASFSISAVDMDLRSNSSSIIGVLNYPSAISLEHSIFLTSKSLFFIFSGGPPVYVPDLIIPISIYVLDSFSALNICKGRFYDAKWSAVKVFYDANFSFSIDTCARIFAVLLRSSSLICCSYSNLRSKAAFSYLN